MFIKDGLLGKHLPNLTGSFLDNSPTLSSEGSLVPT